MRILLVGGTGIISAAVARAALARGIEVTLLNRGSSEVRPAPDGARVLHGDGRDQQAVEQAVGGERFDAVVDFVAFTASDAEGAVATWSGRTDQYVLISSASAYRTPPTWLPITEATTLANPFWEYSRNKIAAEEVVFGAFRRDGFPVTVVRPSHTYDEASSPTLGGWTDLARLLRGAPVVVHGDGTTQWTLTHARDVAEVLVGLLGEQRAVGEAFHITGDEAPTWDSIYRTLAAAAGTTARIVHVPSDTIARRLPDLGPGLLGDRAHSMVFDNARVRSLAPFPARPTTFAAGAREIVAWAQSHAPAPDPELDAAFDELVARFS
ncbi:NAD-dependent epimerase/dehydratase family protein [Actinotalea sp. M2MS4P-6]|uniref:NAD-dependent epimerase/dehydratase family protein n=1 Tax=Actinotalea sp. M2MS4P-6 TaxID=2983762 RepID=UPI0021E45504|nr:NAD-dependent epimerase/dehydratase family protein [Actinotalea sp. M2MS4P-6]MCV2395449.1 NAD-dependent epimerase/dehydratase family protein [Actinotalea sp. M2MS4P-6]